MPLPDLLEIVPLPARPRARLTVPGSKSITNRALILGALGDGETVLRGALWSEDTQVMVECLQELGFMVNVQPEPEDSCNRTITIYGKGGRVPAGGTLEQPLELFVGNAGTAARFLTAFVCLGKGVYLLRGIDRMHQRPQSALFGALRQLSYSIESSNDKLPAVVHGAGPRRGKCQVSIAESSQFASALLLCARVGDWQVSVTGHDQDEASYVAMTSHMVDAFPRTGGRFLVEPDASSGSYFLGANSLLAGLGAAAVSAAAGQSLPGETVSGISVANWPRSGWQIDERFPVVLDQMLQGEMAAASSNPTAAVQVISRARDLGDSIMTAIVVAPFLKTPTRFTELGRLRVQECERVLALRTELSRCGARVVETGDTLEVFPSQLHGAEIETYNDHRMAMCFAILSLKVSGIRIKNPGCVKKTFPNFFQKLAGPPPAGLGAVVVNGRTGVSMPWEELSAA